MRPKQTVLGFQRLSGRAAEYGAFLSYSSRDKTFATKLQSSLETFATPFARKALGMRSFKVCLDDTDLDARPDLWPRIEGLLDKSSYLILLASPESATSEPVEREIGQNNREIANRK